MFYWKRGYARLSTLHLLKLYDSGLQLCKYSYRYTFNFNGRRVRKSLIYRGSGLYQNQRSLLEDCSFSKNKIKDISHINTLFCAKNVLACFSSSNFFMLRQNLFYISTKQSVSWFASTVFQQCQSSIFVLNLIGSFILTQ